MTYINYTICYLQPDCEAFAHAIKLHNDACAELEELRAEAKADLMEEAKVIACTTTSAARNAVLLASVQPTTIIVEEAAQILEAHILATLQPSVKRIILIGDHLQLRPKLECYGLRTESGSGVNFDESLFERLAVRDKYPVQVLNIQVSYQSVLSLLNRNLRFLTPPTNASSVICPLLRFVPSLPTLTAPHAS